VRSESEGVEREGREGRERGKEWKRVKERVEESGRERKSGGIWRKEES
jgi:hypothetical protein